MSAQGVMVMGWPVNRLAVPVLVLLILAMMVLPLPTFMLDVLLTLNIALAMIVLLVSLNARRPLDFSVFPTVLLLTTLLRLSLNVASTRIILMQGHTGPDAAGKVIESFGNFLVGGNIAVGFVVFLILVIINFVVITKGAGRIAEVAARFTLDSMPGKQLAVDADLNAGFINEVEARTRRSEIGREADFYGAMDGASKFVRGDAIAGMIILVVNLIGGIAIGLLQHDLGIDRGARPLCAADRGRRAGDADSGADHFDGGGHRGEPRIERAGLVARVFHPDFRTAANPVCGGRGAGCAGRDSGYAASGVSDDCRDAGRTGLLADAPPAHGGRRRAAGA